MITTTRQFDWTAVKRRLEVGAAALSGSGAFDERRLSEVFRRRAEQYARRAGPVTDQRGPDKLLVFRLGAERYGIELALVAKVFPLVQCTPVPGAPRDLLGLINEGGKIVSVIEGASLLGLPAPQDRDAGYVLLLRQAGSEVGLRVDAVEAIENVAAHELALPEVDIAAQPAGCIAGVAPGRLIVLNVRQLLSHPVFQSDSPEN